MQFILFLSILFFVYIMAEKYLMECRYNIMHVKIEQRIAKYSIIGAAIFVMYIIFSYVINHWSDIGKYIYSIFEQYDFGVAALTFLLTALVMYLGFLRHVRSFIAAIVRFIDGKSEEELGWRGTDRPTETEGVKLSQAQLSKMNRVVDFLKDKNDSSSLLLSGKWGIGKTTVLQLAKNEAYGKDNQQVVWVDFDAWRYMSEEKMVADYYKTIAVALENKIPGHSGVLREIMQAVKPLVGKLDTFGSVAGSAIDIALSHIDKESPEDKIQKIVKRYGLHIVVAVDDVERQQHSALVMRMLQLKAMSGGIEQLKFILIADEEFLVRHIESNVAFKDRGQYYLDKMFDYHYHIPMLNENEAIVYCDTILKDFGGFPECSMGDDNRARELIGKIRDYRSLERVCEKYRHAVMEMGDLCRNDEHQRRAVLGFEVMRQLYYDAWKKMIEVAQIRNRLSFKHESMRDELGEFLTTLQNVDDHVRSIVMSFDDIVGTDDLQYSQEDYSKNAEFIIDYYYSSSNIKIKNEIINRIILIQKNGYKFSEIDRLFSNYPCNHNIISDFLIRNDSNAQHYETYIHLIEYFTRVETYNFIEAYNTGKYSRWTLMQIDAMLSRSSEELFNKIISSLSECNIGSVHPDTGKSIIRALCNNEKCPILSRSHAAQKIIKKCMHDMDEYYKSHDITLESQWFHKALSWATSCKEGSILMREFVKMEITNDEEGGRYEKVVHLLHNLLKDNDELQNYLDKNKDDIMKHWPEGTVGNEFYRSIIYGDTKQFNIARRDFEKVTLRNN